MIMHAYVIDLCRCELGDLSGKHGGLTIMTTDSQFTSVATDSNLPLFGPYTGNSCTVNSTY